MLDSHTDAAEEFVCRVRKRNVDAVEHLVPFGSTARGEAEGIDSDVDFLAVVSDSADQRVVADELRDIAYDLMLEFGPVVEVHVMNQSSFEYKREQSTPFTTNVLREGRSYRPTFARS
jgi:predicted nucleotidyltransferase